MVFNGDIFQQRDDVEKSDTLWLLRRIELCQSDNDLCQLFGRLRGPFSVIFFRKKENKLFFARDAVGRNSLLVGKTPDANWFITSVGGNISGCTVHELPPCGLYYIDLAHLNEKHPFAVYPWREDYSEAERIFGELTIRHHIILDQLPSLVPEKPQYEFHKMFNNTSPLVENLFDFISQSEDINNVCDQLLSALRMSIKERVVNTTKSCKICLPMSTKCSHAKVGILFSGGIDCTILALLADEYVPDKIPIELLNVAFEKINRTSSQQPVEWNVPDRVTGKASVEELRLLRPNRKWIFVEINVLRSELGLHRNRISDLVYPLCNVLDESLGAALWFASKGVGMCNGEPYTSSSRILLLGSGADELFGGYTRHKAAFERCLRDPEVVAGSTESFENAFHALNEELNLDWNRLPSRNLARDDRVISDHGATPRTPYLQEDFIAIVRSLKACQRCYHPLGPGIGDKLILRICAYKLGLREACILRKRALQFGSKIADRKQNAMDRSSFLDH
ncbi:asparagine synthetase domain-containing protein CG17486 isoform X2 [Anopheles coustani]|uniref:asparagine synthetase domain-containing protein CG17486 isoform X2 n=1 Tax=Anopheles coustani TaxID=139045 RepID=UPI002658C02E|nr:asparagine synthetase domain-containing protein CG17486 isoform X2 [Anopheles coustani]